MDKPTPNKAVYAKALSNHIVKVRSYEIPMSIFRGVLWPSGNRKNFQIWIIDGQKELFFEIPVPVNFVNYHKEVTKNWRFTVRDDFETRVCLAEKKDGSRSIQMELPVKKRSYKISVLDNSLGEEMVIFMDISETVVDKGLFGFVVIKNPEKDNVVGN